MPFVLVTKAGKVTEISRQDGDWSDQFNYYYTPTVLIVFALIVTSKQYVGEPITCWTPRHFSKYQARYATDYCWTSNTYYLPFEEHIPQEAVENVTTNSDGVQQHDFADVASTIVYYQWTPIILLVQAFLFYLPCLVWRSLADHSGIDVGTFVESGQMLATVKMESTIRDKIFDKMVRQVNRYLSCADPTKRKQPSTLSGYVLKRTCLSMCGRHQGNYLITVYLFSKALYFANVIMQLLALNALLGNAYSSYGIDVMAKLLRGEDWIQSERFPRVTMCNLKIRRLGMIHRYTVQCILSINLFNEKIFLFLWFWFVMVATFTLISTVVWMVRAITRSTRQRYVRRYLCIAGKVKLKDNWDQENMRLFINDYIRQDGVLLLRMLTSATNGLTAMELTGALWDFYVKKRKKEAASLQTDKTTNENNRGLTMPDPKIKNIPTGNGTL